MEPTMIAIVMVCALLVMIFARAPPIALAMGGIVGAAGYISLASASAFGGAYLSTAWSINSCPTSWQSCRSLF